MDALSSELSEAVAKLQERAGAVTAVYRARSALLAQLRAQKNSLVVERNKLQGAASSTQLLLRSLEWQVQEAAQQQGTARYTLSPLLTQEMIVKHQVTEQEMFRGAVQEKTLAHERLWQQWCTEREREGMEQELAQQVREEEEKLSEMKKKREAVPPPASLSTIAQSLTARAASLKLLHQQEEKRNSEISTQFSPNCNADSIVVNYKDNSEKIERIKNEILILKRENNRDQAWIGCGAQSENEDNGFDDINVVGCENQQDNCGPEKELHKETMNSGVQTSNSVPLSLRKNNFSTEGEKNYNEKNNFSNACQLKNEKESIAVAAARARMNAGLRRREALVKRVEELEKTLQDAKLTRDSITR